jgi:Domain of unknown function (DUF4329)
MCTKVVTLKDPKHPTSTQTVLQQYDPWANGNGGYYSLQGPGSLSYTKQQAGQAAITNINSTSITQDSEYSGNVYKDSNGFYTYTVPVKGDTDSSPFDPTDIPDGTAYSGQYHTHGGNDAGYLNEVFSSTDIGLYESPENQGQPGFLGTRVGRMEVFYPGQAASLPLGCVLSGSPVPGSLGGPVPSCH